MPLKEEKETSYDFLLSYRSLSKAAYSMPKIHYHDNYEVHLLLKGERTILLNNQVLHFNAGDLLFIKSNDIHRFIARNNTPHSRYMIEFQPDFLKPLMADSHINLHELLSVGSHLMTLNIEDLHTIKTLFDALKQMTSTNSDSITEHNHQHIIGHFSDLSTDMVVTYNKALVKLKLAELLLQMSLIRLKQPTDSQEEVANNSLHKKIPMIIEYIHKHYKSPLTIDMICQTFYISKSYFCKLFKEVTGTSFIHYLNEVRIKEAKVLLLTTQSKVAALAVELGFNSSTHFGRTFKEITGYSPRDYRKVFL